ncbi:MAG TPA: helix-hairpin-helix domain-containing protein [Cyclobacteriaceae bacterium]|nr:helix-hairpin-helix domain-containing protein [Cyclobacteriaceae bacterium]
MRKIKAWIRLLLGFSQTETNAFIILLPLMFIVIISEPVYRTYFMYNKPGDIQDTKRLDSLIATWDWPDGKKRDSVVLFAFDPNTATKEELTQLGIPSRTASGIINYRNKGGRFKAKSDLKKMYGLDTNVYASLVPHIRLPERSNTIHRSSKPAKKQVEKFDLNLADTTQLKSIYGIGPVIARRITSYKSSLGGFIMLDQLYEVWGLDSATVRRLSEKTVIAPGFMPNKLPINHCGEQELARHPYIRTKLARAIVNYRFQHGNFAAVDDLTKIAGVDEKAFHRIKPYITIE